MDKKRALEKEIFELIGQSYADNSVATVGALESACKILDYKFGNDFHKKHPELVVELTETLMKNIRMKDFRTSLQSGIGEYLDALRIVILEKDFPLKGNVSIDVNGSLDIDN